MEQLQEPHLHFNVYHLDKSLLFQFILSESLIACKHMESIASSIPELKSRKKALLCFAFEELLGLHCAPRKFIAWTSNEGVLFKLKSFCAAFVQQVKSQDKLSLALSHLANQTWLQSLQCHEAVCLWIGEQANREHQANAYKQISKLLHCHARWTKTLVQKLKDFRADENVLFYVLRHHKDFDAYFGKGFVNQLFNKLFPDSTQKKLNTAEKYICNQYAKRGFDHLLPCIVTKISEIQSAL